MHAWLLGLSHFIKWEFTFTEIEDLLKGNEISRHIKEVLVEKLWELSLNQVLWMLPFLWEKDDTYLIFWLIKKLEKLDFHEIKHLLGSPDISESIQRSFIWKIERVQLWEVLSYIHDEEVPLSLRRALAERIIYDCNTQEFLEENGYNWWVQSRAVEVNRWQHKLLVWDIILPPAFQQIPDSRTLNFYYRAGQGAFRPHFEILVRLLQDYIDWNNSQIWTDFRVLQRWSSHEKDLGWIEMSQATGNEFRSQSSIYADTIHLTHGTPEMIPWTHAIVGKWVYRDGHKLKGIYYSKGEYSRIPLIYAKEGHKDGLWFPTNATIQEICEVVLTSLQNAEKRILANIDW